MSSYAFLRFMSKGTVISLLFDIIAFRCANDNARSVVLGFRNSFDLLVPLDFHLISVCD